MPQDIRNLVISGVISLVVGLAVYLLAGSEASGLRVQIADLTAQVQTLRASQASVDQRLSDGDLQQKATILRVDETFARLAAVDKALAPPAPPAAEPDAAATAAPATPPTTPEPATPGPAAPGPGTKAP